ncbi:rod shape-determining protein MreC [Pokkaliibacter plantistimulans]|uniref:rod shape-determining protein MreC n=1 Tax=Pokkaliibacter plantistimulans TaxID=1635171 RepID=UPI000D74D822|nr:rod shape-determining protein MreC [Pokkaliibacter plantistimulans]
MRSIFRSSSSKWWFWVLVCLSLSLLVADRYWSGMSQVRSWLTVFTAPLQWVVDVPNQVWSAADRTLANREQLQQDNDRLRTQVLFLERQVQKMASTTAENIRLRELLNASQRLDERVLLADLIGVNPDPFQHQIVLNKGSNDNVYVGQAVLDAGGIMGQVVEVGPYTSRVLLITDAAHAIPVQVNRNGLRAIAFGEGVPGVLSLEHVPDTADIAKGDLLISSGLGGRFPYGYPVGEVTEVIHDPGEPFALVKVKPSAQLDRSRHVLLLFPSPQPLVDPAAVPAEGADAQAGSVPAPASNAAANAGTSTPQKPAATAAPAPSPDARKQDNKPKPAAGNAHTSAATPAAKKVATP